MTLLVGIRCQDAVVVAADSAATMGGPGRPTVRQAVDRKIEIVDERAIIAVSGPVGLGQRFKGELELLVRDNKALRGPAWKSMQEIRTKFASHIRDEFLAARDAIGVIGGAAQESALSATIVAITVPGKGPTLLHFDPQGAPEEATDQLPFVCLGSGQSNADPFLAFVKDVFWDPHTLPTLPEAIFAALWTVQQAILVAPGGIAGDIHVAVLAADGTKHLARAVDPTELEEHFQAIQSAKDALRNFKHFDQIVSPPPSAEVDE